MCVCLTTLTTAKQESDVSCICPTYLLVTSCVAAVGWCCRARVHITCIAFVGCLLNLIVFESDTNCIVDTRYIFCNLYMHVVYCVTVNALSMLFLLCVM